MVRRTSDRALEQMTDPLLQDPVGGEPDRVLDPLVFQVLVDPWRGEGGVGAEVDPRHLTPIAGHDRVKHVLPAVGTMNVAGRRAQRSRSPNWLNTKSGW